MSSKAINVQTPVVELQYLNLIKPDDKYDKENPKFQVSWKLDPKAGKAFIAEIQEKAPGFKVPHRRDDDDNYIFKAAQKKYITWMKEGVLKRHEFTPTLLTEDNQKYEGAEPWGGSTGEVAFTIRETRGENKGITFSLRGVRFKDVKIGGESTGGSGDPLFGSNTKEIDDIPKPVPEMEQSDDEDDIPFN